jgi:hypothetical protein
VSDVFQEVEEEYRRQQLAKLWEKYRVPIIGAAAALILGVAGYQGWTWWHGKEVDRSSREMEAVGDLMRANPQAEKDAADRLAKLAANGSGGYPLLAKFQEAGMRAQLREFAVAVKLYDDIARSGGDPLFAGYAQIRAAVLLSETASYDDMKKRLEALANGTGAWRLEAKELLAYAAWRGGKPQDALKLYGEIEKAEDVSVGVKRRSYEMSALIKAGLKFADLKPPASAALPQPEGPLLLQPRIPTPAVPEVPSLLGPEPIVPAPIAPSTPTP